MVANYGLHKMAQIHSAGDGASDARSLYVIKSEMWRSVERVTDHSSTSREAEVTMGGARMDGRWGPMVLKWEPRTGKRSVSRPFMMWTDDIKRVAGSR
ncbi:jg5504 [Pararge aegeria aegeria]|uniref:Jg5504 protein n=1 Tax=Pararge aegeria aegeria TaxID=348720 RepID=A0A8S4SNK7_9NEOP|nr:jg5504 [Pararge aegeria aegeria]